MPQPQPDETAALGVGRFVRFLSARAVPPPSVLPSFRPSVLPSFRPSVLPSFRPSVPRTEHQPRDSGRHSRTHFCLLSRPHATFDFYTTGAAPATARSPADRFPIATHFRKTRTNHLPDLPPDPHPMPPYSPAPPTRGAGSSIRIPAERPGAARPVSADTKRRNAERSSSAAAVLRRAAYSNAAQALTVCSAMRVRPASVSFSF